MLYLYSTSHCHLCELAQTLLTELNVETVNIVEIADDDQLLLEYGIRIPVLKREDTKAELDWPFNSADIALFLR
ncbi:MULTISPECIES: glutaredoxin family protein [Methylotenera]|uniref:glutaredoxin family protein n=1 Tax=Methylotenera TaxID=359407 RepID=UPI000378F2A3|nr:MULTISPECIES: glutaredoxin family protein [Methylotenera]